jgi:ABC-type antimicrobial peptide transport system, ATPase component
MIELHSITKIYKPKKGPVVEALKGVDLAFEDKGLVFILGKSGSGKTTLLNVIGGLDKYDSGEAVVDGKSSKAFKDADFDLYRRNYIGFIFQDGPSTERR